MKLRDIRFLRLVFVFMCLSLETIAKEIRVGDYFYELNGMEAILMRPASLTQKKYEVPEKIEYEGEDFMVTAIGGYKAFSGSRAVTIVLPNTIKSIAPYAFHECKQLKNIQLPSSLTCISWKAFSGCENLRYMIIPSSVSHVGWDAFRGCTRLKTVVFLSSILHFGGFVFRDCPLLRTVVYACLDAPVDWFAAPETFVPEASKYVSPRWNTPKGEVKDLVAWTNCKRNGNAVGIYRLSCISNIKGYAATPMPEVLKGEKCDTIPVKFTNGEYSFTIKIPYHNRVH